MSIKQETKKREGGGPRQEDAHLFISICTKGALLLMLFSV